MIGEAAQIAIEAPFGGSGFLWDARIADRRDLWRVALPPSLIDLSGHADLADRSWAEIANGPARLGRVGEHRAFFETVRGLLERGPGFALIDRIPIETLAYRDLRLLHLLLAKRFGALMPQDSAGNTLCDVVDPDDPEDAPETDDNPGRRWNRLPCHTDQAFGRVAPRFLAFLCHRAAEIGGAVRLASGPTLVRSLRALSPDHIAALSRPVPFDARRQLDAGDAALPAVPVLARGPAGDVVRYLHAQIDHDRLEPNQARAIAALEALLAREDLIAPLRVEPGQVLFVNNRLVLHGRDPFRNNPLMRASRHHIRLWLT